VPKTRRHTHGIRRSTISFELSHGRPTPARLPREFEPDRQSISHGGGKRRQEGRRRGEGTRALCGLSVRELDRRRRAQKQCGWSANSLSRAACDYARRRPARSRTGLRIHERANRAYFRFAARRA